MARLRRGPLPGRIFVASLLTFVLGTAAGGSQRPAAQSDGWRTIAFDTTEVTQADVTVSPDNRWLVFTILGHLFRMPVEGGAAEQLTFGPHYDSDPVFSPDGARVAFVSDREDSDRNVFVLNLSTRQIAQVTREPWADRPNWSPDGQAIVYLAPVGEPRPFNGLLTLVSAWVRRIRIGGEPETLNAARGLTLSAFYLADGRPAWTEMKPPEDGSSRVTTRVDALGAGGAVSALGTFEVHPDRVIASPGGDGLYCRCYASVDLPPEDRSGFRRSLPVTEQLLFLPFREDARPRIVPLSRVAWLHNVWNNRTPFRFGVTADNRNLYIGDAGRIWKIETASGAREPVSFTARVRLEVRDPVRPRRVTFADAGTSASPRVVQEPRLSPDGASLVFGAAGYLWRQRLDGGPARRLFEGTAFEREPAFSPDGRHLAYVRVENGREDIRVFTFASRETRTISTGSGWGLSWSPDGRRVVFGEQGDSENRVVAVTISDGKKETIADASLARPHLSADGQWLFGTAGSTMRRFRVGGPATPEPLARLDRGVRDGLVSSDGKWLGFRRNAEIWAAALGAEPVLEKDVRQLSAEGAEGYALTPDGTAAIYASRNRVWRQRLADGAREEIPIRLTLPRATRPPLLLRRVRVLNDTAGGFSPESSIYIDQERIQWIGSERGRDIPRDAVILDAGARFAIPGLFDMHTHAGAAGIRQDGFIAYGVTSIRDAGSSLRWLGALADHLDVSGAPGPRSFYAGENFNYVAPSNVGPPYAIRDEDSARAAVRSWHAQGAQFIKAYSSLSWRLRRAVADEARRLGLPVFGHGMSVEETTKSVALGYASLEHFDRNGRIYDDMLEMLAAAGTRWDPTLEAVWGNDLLLRDEPERLRDPKLLAFMPPSSIRSAGAALIALNPHMLRGLWANWLGSIQPAQRLGVRLLAGSDTTGGRIFPGASLHWELEHLVEARLTPLEVLRIATEQAAATVGAQDDLGTIAVGKLADIVLLDQNPLDDIKNTQGIWRVLKGGWVFDPDTLRASTRGEARGPIKQLLGGAR